MKNINKWLITIDSAIPADTYFYNIGKLASIFEPKSIHFLYQIETKLNLDLHKEFPDLHLPQVSDIEHDHAN
ncbi:hypothetical protein E1176_07755 [Fulvivirga sp. RKSG066]|uniref:hypothetical protein n=1 Tax=Fulvivirga aurantia TaxID=2529383 RepID=UPI0012BBE2E3|nr:hypothetical protein [Fulvivirga aurantia]MTI20912.1 hypothetical protein [Fulvivirga aurantia]